MLTALSHLPHPDTLGRHVSIATRISSISNVTTASPEPGSATSPFHSKLRVAVCRRFSLFRKHVPALCHPASLCRSGTAWRGIPGWADYGRVCHRRGIDPAFLWTNGLDLESQKWTEPGHPHLLPRPSTIHLGWISSRHVGITLLSRDWHCYLYNRVQRFCCRPVSTRPTWRSHGLLRHGP